MSLDSYILYSEIEEPVSRILDGNDLDAVVRYLKSPACRNVFVLTGAGLSTAAGIPDFRSPKTGLYANLAKLDLPYPEAVFDIGFFCGNPIPFYTLARDLAPGRFRPTLGHSFVRLLHEKDLLHTCFTQNIDTLERKAGVPSDKIVEAHGSFASQKCIRCSTPFDDDRMKQAIQSGNVPYCSEKGCGGLVKPDIVFFGQSLPESFSRKVPTLKQADLLIILGTSLKVYPFAMLPQLASCPRVLINLEQVGDIGSRPDDVLLLKPCDDVVRELCDAMGWQEDLERLWAETELPPGVEALPPVTIQNSPPPAQEPRTPTQYLHDLLSGVFAPGKFPPKRDEPSKDLEERLEAEVEQMTKDVEKGLKISEEEQEHPSASALPVQDKEGVPKTEQTVEEPSANQDVTNVKPEGDAKRPDASLVKVEDIQSKGA